MSGSATIVVNHNDLLNNTFVQKLIADGAKKTLRALRQPCDGVVNETLDTIAYARRKLHKQENADKKNYVSTKWSYRWTPLKGTTRMRLSHFERTKARNARGGLSPTAQASQGLDSYERPTEYKNFVQSLHATAPRSRLVSQYARPYTEVLLIPRDG